MRVVNEVELSAPWAGDVAVVPPSAETATGCLYIERDGARAQAVIHEVVGLHSDEARGRVDETDPKLPKRVQEAMAKNLPDGWRAAVEFSDWDDAFSRGLRIAVEPTGRIFLGSTDAQVAEAMKPALDAVWAAIDPHSDHYVFREVGRGQREDAWQALSRLDVIIQRGNSSPEVRSGRRTEPPSGEQAMRLDAPER